MLLLAIASIIMFLFVAKDYVRDIEKRKDTKKHVEDVGVGVKMSYIYPKNDMPVKKQVQFVSPRKEVGLKQDIINWIEANKELDRTRVKLNKAY